MSKAKDESMSHTEKINLFLKFLFLFIATGMLFVKMWIGIVLLIFVVFDVYFGIVEFRERKKK